MNNIMVDIETIGTGPGCIILSIGAVAFDPNKNQIGSKFYRVVNYQSCKRIGLFADPRTLQWWDMQSSQSRNIIKQSKSKDAQNIFDVLMDFNNYIKMYNKNNDVMLWGNGSDFDNAILQYTYARLAICPEWKYYNNRCFRTLCSLFPKQDIKRIGVYHRADDDAMSQALHTIKLLGMIK